MYDVAYMYAYVNCQNAIVVTADLHYVCKIVQLLHAACPFSARHSSQMRSGYLGRGGRVG